MNSLILLVAGTILSLIGIFDSKSEGHGSINMPGAYRYPDLGRKATKLYGIIQMFFLIPMVMVVIFLDDYWGLSLICMLVPAIISIIYCELMCKKRYLLEEKNYSKDVLK